MKPCPSILEQLELFPPAGKGIGMAIGTAVILGQSLERVDPGSGSPGLPLPIIPFEAEV